MTDPDPTPEEPSEMPDPIAQRDQALANIRDLAFLIGGYHDALIEAGLSAEKAFGLTLAYQALACQQHRFED